ncbi:tape measure protein [Pseudarthrobacter scleromae]|uniref:tape measure protein n=1 Tax=Pseudarthrobacter scleromae TaxID=158897 RepID=UPI00363DC047
MSNVGYATLTVIPSAKGFASALTGEITGPMDSAGADAGRKSGGSFVGAFKGLVGAGIAVAAGGMFSGFIAEAARASDATDKFKATMNFAGLDTSSIEAATKAAKEFADQTVYDLPTIQNTIAQLASNGVADYTGLTKAAGNLNAVAGGNAETFKSVAMVMTQTAGAGKLTTENWNQLADAIPGASGPLMKAMEEAGAYTGNFRDAMAEGEITAEEFNAALMKLGTDPIAVEAAKSTATFEGAIGNLQATINSGLMSALDGMKPAITGAINLLANGLGGAFTKAGSAMEPLTGAVRAFGNAWRENNGDVTSDGLAGVFERVANAIRPIWDALAPLGTVVQAVVTQFSPLSIAFRALEPVLPVLLSTITQLGVGIAGTLTAAVAQLVPFVQTFVSILSGVFVAIMPAITAMLLTLGNAFTQLVPVVMSVLGAILPLATTLLTQLAPIITNLVTAILPPVVSIFDNIVNAVGPLVTLLAALLVPAIQALMPVVVTVFQVVVDVITSAMQIVQGIIQVVTGVITGNWENVWTGLGNILSGAWDVITGLVSGGVQILGALIGAALSYIGSLWNSAWSGISSFLGGVWGNIASAVSSGIGEVVNFFSGLWGRVTGAIGDIGSKMSTIGLQMIQGLANGISGAANLIREAVAGAIGNVVDFAKSLLGIHSPSRVFMEIGDFTAQGMAIGLTKGAKHVEKAAAKALVPAAPSFASPDVTAGGVRAGAEAGLPTGSPLIGSLTLQSSGNVREDMEEVLFHTRRIARGGVYA